ncbi:methionine ABC transporter permease [Cellulomonas marina]|uniref:D-methionine transport system permease protein n=1 Tax=Cellulomonas marina TaxID=988821 RepID=A0A1I1ACZ9_9CELL|nr:ABC transporter permease subunit [Cellulomonas marina]GIG30591.1 putative ABC-type transporter, permease component [Cellulomonas marina]SFB34213.1 D-methionine transport system permease protein [Cellulomonas marina]
MTNGSTSLWPVLLASLGETLWMVAVTLLIGGLLGLALGIALYVTRAGNLLPNRAVHAVLNVAVNLVRPIPFIIFLTAVQPLTIAVTGTSYGTRAVIFPMVIMATFGTSRIVEQNLVALDPGVVEAARAMGAGPLRIIGTVIVPETLGPLILGYTFLFVAVVDMSAMAGAVAGGGLGDFALQYGYQRFNPVATWVAVAVIVALVHVAQAVGNTLARRVLRR